MIHRQMLARFQKVLYYPQLSSASNVSKKPNTITRTAEVGDFVCEHIVLHSSEILWEFNSLMVYWRWTEILQAILVSG